MGRPPPRQQRPNPPPQLATNGGGFGYLKRATDYGTMTLTQEFSTVSQPARIVLLSILFVVVLLALKLFIL